MWSLVAQSSHQLHGMRAVLGSAKGESGEPIPALSLLFDEFEHEMVLLIPGVRLSIKGPRPIWTQLV